MTSSVRVFDDIKMFVRTYLMILVLGCAACGLFLYFGLEQNNRVVEQAANFKSKGAVLISDFRRLQDSYSQWLVLTDLVFGSDATYVCGGATELGNSIVELAVHVQNSAPAETHQEFGKLIALSTAQCNRLHSSLKIGEHNRRERLNELLLDSDQDSAIALDCLTRIEKKLASHLQHCNDALRTNIMRRRTRNSIMLGCFCCCVAALWVWISEIVSRPISQLSEATNRALLQRELQAKLQGPLEVKTLNLAFKELFGDLTHQIELQKKTREERETLYEKLLETSRQAGMAEVATGVLHNVGNVLNSVRVSASIAHESAQQSIVGQLKATNDLVRSKQGDLGHFLTRDPRGKKFPEALDYLTIELLSENETQLDELTKLVERVDHIEQIVKSQQVYAKTESSTEFINLNELIEDAIAIKRHTLATAGVLVIRQFEGSYKIKSERHRLLQIIVNLLANAFDAIQMSEDTQREITIRVTPVGSRLQVSVQDTGIGIREDHLKKLFNHGFTTKEEGHGFGLHSSALAAQALGAELSAKSDGPNRGAIFILDLPIEQHELCKV